MAASSSPHHQHHHHNLVISNPFTNDDNNGDDDSFVSVPAPVPPTSTTGLRAQLHHILPRHAFFHVQVVIHEIASVPLISGEFAVRWKFKNAHSAPANKSGSGLLSIVTGHKMMGKGKGKAGEEDVEGDDHASLKSSSGSSSGSSSTSSRTIPTAVNSNSSPSLTSNATSTASANPSSQSTPSLSAVPNATTPARGQTPFLKLRDHGVTWEHTLSILVRMDVDRDPQSHLLPSPLKLVILHHDDAPGGLTKPFGVVYLDLAQYACKGEVTRRYLLRESKTNATLKLTTHLTHLPTTSPSSSSSSIITSVSNSTNTFTAPPLPKGEILNGISGILQGSALGIIGENDIYRIRPKGLDLYGPYYDQTELEIDLLGRASSPRSHLHLHSKAKGKAKAKEKPTHSRTVSTDERVFDPTRLPLAYGPRTTETLIEALFNPVRTTEKRRESPFTVYVPPAPRTPHLSDSGWGSRLHSVKSTASTSTSTSATVVSPSPGTTPKTTTAKAPSPSRAARHQPKCMTPTRSGSSGIGAGLGIMGFGMGMGVGVGVSGTRESMEGGAGGVRQSLDGERQGVDKGAGRMSLEGETDLGKRQTSEGGVSGVSEVGEKVNVKEENGGVIAWWKKQRSHPGTSTPIAGLAH